MSDLVGNPNCWFSHAHAHLSCFLQDVLPYVIVVTRTPSSIRVHYSGLTCYYLMYRHFFHILKSGLPQTRTSTKPAYKDTNYLLRFFIPQVPVLNSLSHPCSGIQSPPTPLKDPLLSLKSLCKTHVVSKGYGDKNIRKLYDIRALNKTIIRT